MSIKSEFRKMILIQIEDTENFPSPEVWTDNLLVALMNIIKTELPKERTTLEIDGEVHIYGMEAGYNQAIKDIKHNLGVE